MKFHLTYSFIIALLVMSCSSPSNKSDVGNPIDSVSTPTSKSSNPSIYDLDGKWITQNKKTITLNELKGKVRVVAMIFTHCSYACPRIVADMKSIESQIPPDKMNRVGFVLISFDTERDSIQRLNDFYNELNLNPNWTLLRGIDEKVRELSILLNVQYAKQEDGNFSHSNIITVLDENGSIQFQKEGLEVDPGESVETIKGLLLPN